MCTSGLECLKSYLAVQTLCFYIICFIRESCTGVNKILHMPLQIIYKLNLFNVHENFKPFQKVSDEKYDLNLTSYPLRYEYRFSGPMV